MATSVGYNLNHVQVAAKGPTPTYTDLRYAINMDPTISQDVDKLRADAAAVVSAYSAPEGTGTLSFGSMDSATLAILTGGTASTSGSGATLIDRLEIEGDTNPPAIILAAWIPNVDGNASAEGVRITLPNAKASVPSGTFDQETWANRDADLTFDPDEFNVLMVYEFLATAPTFTSGVMPVILPS